MLAKTERSSDRAVWRRAGGARLSEAELRHCRYSARILEACVRLELNVPFGQVLDELVAKGISEIEARYFMELGFAGAFSALTERAAGMSGAATPPD